MLQRGQSHKPCYKQGNKYQKQKHEYSPLEYLQCRCDCGSQTSSGFAHICPQELIKIKTKLHNMQKIEQLRVYSKLQNKFSHFVLQSHTVNHLYHSWQ